VIKENAMSLPSDDQLAELPCTRNVCSLPSVSIRNRSETNGIRLAGHSAPDTARRRLLSNTIFLPSGDRPANPSPSELCVKRRTFAPSSGSSTGCMR
jgi:hypothetical protein